MSARRNNRAIYRDNATCRINYVQITTTFTYDAIFISTQECVGVYGIRNPKKKKLVISKRFVTYILLQNVYIPVPECKHSVTDCKWQIIWSDSTRFFSCEAHVFRWSYKIGFQAWWIWCVPFLTVLPFFKPYSYRFLIGDWAIVHNHIWIRKESHIHNIYIFISQKVQSILKHYYSENTGMTDFIIGVLYLWRKWMVSKKNGCCEICNFCSLSSTL